MINENYYDLTLERNYWMNRSIVEESPEKGNMK